MPNTGTGGITVPKPQVDSGVPVEPTNTIKDLSGTTLCSYEDDDAMAFLASPQALGFSLARHSDTMGLAYHNELGERALQLFELTGSPKAAALTQSLPGSEGVHMVALDGGFALTWWVNDELFGEWAGLEGEAAGEPVRLTSMLSGSTASMLAAAEPQGIVIALQGNDGIAIARYKGDTPRAVDTKPFPQAGSSATHAKLGMLGGEPVLAWSTTGSIALGHLDSDDVVTLADNSNGRFDLAATEAYGALAYGYNVGSAELVRYQPFDQDGSVSLEARTVQQAPALLRDAAIVPFGTGFAVAYRSLVSRDFPDNTIRVAFMTQSGQIVYGGTLEQTSRAGGATDIVATEDGHLTVSWYDTDDNMIRVRRLNCPEALKLCSVER